MKRLGSLRERGAEATEKSGREADAAADHDEGRIEQLLEIEDQAGDGRGRAGEDLLGPGGAGFARGEDAAGVDIVAGGPRRCGHAAAAGDVLDADARVDGQRRLADARREAVMAGKQPPAGHDAAADAGGYGEEDDVLSFARAEAVLTPRRGLRIVGEGHGLAEAVAERGAEREAGRDREDGGVQRIPAPVPDLSGDGRGHRPVAPGPIGDERGQRVAPPSADAVARGRDIALVVDTCAGNQRCEHLGAADVDREDRIVAHAGAPAVRRPPTAVANHSVMCSGRVIAEPTTTAKAPASMAAFA